MKIKTLLLAIGFVVFWNSGFVGADYVLPQTEPFTLLFWRYLGLSFYFLSICIQKKDLLARLENSSSQYGYWLFSAWRLVICTFFAFENGVQSGIVALVIALHPIATGALSGIITGEKTSKMQWLGLVIGFIGVAVSVAFRLQTNNNASLFGYLILLGSVLSMAIATLIQRQMEMNNTSNKLRTEQMLFFQSIATAAAAFLPAVFVEQLSTNWNMKFTLSLGWLIVGVSLIAYALMWKLIERISATKVSSCFT